MPVYFERVVRLRAADPESPLEGGGRLHTEHRTPASTERDDAEGPYVVNLGINRRVV